MSAECSPGARKAQLLAPALKLCSSYLASLPNLDQVIFSSLTAPVPDRRPLLLPTTHLPASPNPAKLPPPKAC